MNACPYTMEQHEEFKKSLRGSLEFTRKAARFLERRGWRAWYTKTKFAPTPEEREQFSDNGDIWAWPPRPMPRKRMRFEAKHLIYDFTCREDWPFPGEFIVTQCNKWDKAKQKPYQYILGNRLETHVAIVQGADRPKWWPEIRRTHKGEVQRFYFTTEDLVEFVPFDWRGAV